MSTCPLVYVEWEDSAQPVAAWAYLSDVPQPSAVLCASVGWLIRDDKNVKAIAPNMGNLMAENSVQVSGVIQIPTRCITRIVQLDEPELTSFSAVLPSRPDSEPTLQAS